MTEPVASGRYPAVLRVPGAGVRSYHGQVDLSAKGIIVLEIGIHGIPVDLPDAVYESLRLGALAVYPTYNLDSRDHYYYLRVYLGCIRANDVLTTSDMWNGKDLVVAGGSQGGQLSLVVAGLDNRVTGCVANYPAYCDVTGYLHGRAGGWPHMFESLEGRSHARIETTAYYDAVNFARRIHVPTSLGWGYNDTICPPTSMYAAYNVIGVSKTLNLHLNMGHSSAPEFEERFVQRILEVAHASESTVLSEK